MGHGSMWQAKWNVLGPFEEWTVKLLSGEKQGGRGRRKRDEASGKILFIRGRAMLCVVACRGPLGTSIILISTMWWVECCWLHSLTSWCVVPHKQKRSNKRPSEPPSTSLFHRAPYTNSPKESASDSLLSVLSLSPLLHFILQAFLCLMGPLGSWEAPGKGYVPQCCVQRSDKGTAA